MANSGSSCGTFESWLDSWPMTWLMDGNGNFSQRFVVPFGLRTVRAWVVGQVWERVVLGWAIWRFESWVAGVCQSRTVDRDVAAQEIG